MNEIIITIALKKNDVFFKDCYESVFLNVLLNALNSYGIKTEDIFQFSMQQEIQLCHSPYVFNGCVSSEKFKTKTQKRKQKKGETDDEFNERQQKKGETDDKK